jgi:hypothetical protein
MIRHASRQIILGEMERMSQKGINLGEVEPLTGMS